MHIEFLVEEPSTEAALKNLIPGILEKHHTFKIHPFQRKPDLLKNLPDRLRAYKEWIPKNWRIVVLVDEDREDCLKLKNRLEIAAKGVGLKPKTSCKGRGTFKVLNRLAVEELEAWFFGDVEAVRATYPRIPATLGQKARYRDPDRITGGTWEALEREMKKAGYYSAGMPKIEVSRNISRHMNTTRNRSQSFRVFIDGIRASVS